MDFYTVNLQGFVHETNIFSFTKPTKCTHNAAAAYDSVRRAG